MNMCRVVSERYTRTGEVQCAWRAGRAMTSRLVERWRGAPFVGIRTLCVGLRTLSANGRPLLHVVFGLCGEMLGWARLLPRSVSPGG